MTMIASILMVLNILLLPLTIIGLILAVFECNNLWSSYQKEKRRTDLGDLPRLIEDLEKWEPVVLARCGTLRHVKRFANRARFLTADKKLAEMLSQLVGFIALEEIGLIDPSVLEFSTDKWQQDEWWESVKSKFTEKDGEIVEEWLKTVELKDWQYYQALVIDGRPPARRREVN